MKLLSFFTRKIQFQSLEDLHGFTNHYSQFLVHPTNFLNEDGTPIYADMCDEPFDGNRIVGVPLNFEVNEDECTVIMSGEGGLNLSRIVTTNGFSESGKIEGNLLEDVFDEQFASKNPGFEIYLEEEDSATGDIVIDTIRLYELYSAQAVETQYHSTCDQIHQIEQQVVRLHEQKLNLEKKAAILKEKLRQMIPAGFDSDCDLPF